VSDAPRFIDPPGLFRSPRYTNVVVFGGLAFVAGQTAVGAVPADIVKVNGYVVDRRSLPELVEIRRRFLGEIRRASTTVVAGLFREELLIEVEAVVALRDR
jgi:enamine deaminase RidA (YjgF/YER057c/UK114 family)